MKIFRTYLFVFELNDCVIIPDDFIRLIDGLGEKLGEAEPLACHLVAV